MKNLFIPLLASAKSRYRLIQKLKIMCVLMVMALSMLSIIVFAIYRDGSRFSQYYTYDETASDNLTEVSAVRIANMVMRDEGYDMSIWCIDNPKKDTEKEVFEEYLIRNNNISGSIIYKNNLNFQRRIVEVEIHDKKYKARIVIPK